MLKVKEVQGGRRSLRERVMLGSRSPLDVFNSSGAVACVFVPDQVMFPGSSI